MDKIGKITGGLLTIALASTISISEYEEKVKSALPEISMNKLKHDQKRISSVGVMTTAQLEIFEKELAVMKTVNDHTKDVFIPALQANLQRWSKEDIDAVRQSIAWIQTALTTRLKQYDVLSKMVKKAKAPSVVLAQLQALINDSKNSKQAIHVIKSETNVLEEALALFNASQKVDANMVPEDFWLPTISIEEKNVLIVTNQMIQESNDYEALNLFETKLQHSLSLQLSRTKHFSEIALG